MKNLLTICFLFLNLFLVFLTNCSPQKGKKTTQDSVQNIVSKNLSKNIKSVENKQISLKKAKLDLIFQELVKEKNFNGAVFWREKDKIVLQQSYGYAKNNIPLNLTNAYFLGNITETMTALGIFYLEKKEFLNRKDSVIKYIAQFPYPNITIQDLLQHSSGLPDFKNAFLKENNTLFTYATNRNVLDWLVVEKPMLTHNIGEKTQQSPTNYVILARIIELVSQENFAFFLGKIFFKPLQMSQTSVLAYKNHDTHLIKGYDHKTNKLLDDSPFMYVQGSEGVCASVLDLEKWDTALHNPTGKFYALAKNLFEIPTITNPTQASGWAVNGSFFFKQGNNMGYKTAFYYFPNDDRTFILLSNNNTNKFNDILKMMYGVIHE